MSSGHIFAQNGRKIDRPNGRCDYLLFYLAKDKELFYLNIETIADAGSFIFFGPFEKQEHIYTEKESASQGRYFDAISFVIQKMNKGYQNNYTLDEYAKMNKQNAHLYQV